MKGTIKQRWLAALRSGSYKKGVGALREEGESGNHDRFCCLGVLTDLAVQEGVTTWEEVENSGWGVLPPEVRTWAGLDEEDPVVPTVGGLTWTAPRSQVLKRGEPLSSDELFRLSVLNDCTTATFDNIADSIEAGIAVTEESERSS